MKVFISVLCVVTILVVIVGATSGGYIVILKNGERIRCNEPLAIDGNLAIITLITGQVTSYPIDHIDLVATERYNKLGLGDALTIDELERNEQIPPTPTPRRTLGNYATLSGLGDQVELSSDNPPTPTPTPGIKLQPESYKDPQVSAAFIEVLDKKNLYLYRTSTGTRPDYFFIQAVTDTQREVFHALKTVAEAFDMIATRRPDLAPSTVELRMVETSGRTAGTFRLTQEDAAELAGGAIPTEKFYVENVIF
ncbi:MAG: hypothetical protein KAJ78_05510 [Acidobacteria bacterium]|nr:hypothetical protein [Acidobacteriota bacterium]